MCGVVAYGTAEQYLVYIDHIISFILIIKQISKSPSAHDGKGTYDAQEEKEKTFARGQLLSRLHCVLASSPNQYIPQAMQRTSE